jgi:hypothetical protein
MNTWQEYYQNTKDKPASELLKLSMKFVSNKSTALDLGSGALADSKYLLSEGFEVIAVDKEEISDEIANDKFKFIRSSFEDYNFPTSLFNLINAQFSLPFNGRESFLYVWEKMLSSLKTDGIFVGQLFGEKDEWNKPGTGLAFFSRNQIKFLLNGTEILKFEEIEKDGRLANDDSKHWHFFDIIARQTN